MNGIFNSVKDPAYGLVFFYCGNINLFVSDKRSPAGLPLSDFQMAS